MVKDTNEAIKGLWKNKTYIKNQHLTEHMNIAFFELEEWQKKELQEKLNGHTLHFFEGALSEGNLPAISQIDVLGVFIYSKVTKSVIDQLPNLKLIATMSTGFDHIDVAYCRQKGIAVCNVPTYGENTVAEHTFALILALSRNLYPSIKRTHEQQSFETDASLRGFDLKGKTFGAIGCGNIGKHAVRMAVGFEMKVLIYNRSKDPEIERMPNVQYTDLDTLLKNSDIVSLAMPYNKSTHHILNKDSIEKMKKGTYIINTSRGALMETHALIQALKSGHIAGAGLDVLEEECEVKEELSVLKDEFKATCDLRVILDNHLLMKMPNVIVTPHNAFNSHEALHRILETTLANIAGYGKGSLQNNVAA
jgi:D-lactate dehydrogenase